MNQKTRKNLALTVLACLNCVHTTYAVEESKHVDVEMYSPSIEEENIGQDNLNKLATLYALQDELCALGYILKDFDVMHDAFIQGAETVSQMTKQMAQNYYPHNPTVQTVIGIRRDIVEDLKNLDKNDLAKIKQLSSSLLDSHMSTLFNEKLKPLFDSNKIQRTYTPQDWNIVQNIPTFFPYERDIYHTYPQLKYMPLIDRKKFPHKLRLHSVLSASTNNHLTNLLSNFDNTMEDIEKDHSDIAQKKWHLERRLWAQDLNRYLTNDIQGVVSWLDNLGNVIQQLDESPTKTAQALKETILDQIQKNLLGENQDLKAKTETLLAKDPELGKMVLNHLPRSGYELDKGPRKRQKIN